MDPYDHCAALVRRGDRDRYVAALLAPAASRRHLLALQAFDLEIAAIAGRVSEPIPGEIRLQWWRDVLSGTAEGAGGHPVATALTTTIRECLLPLDPLEALIDARIFDLYGEPMPSLAGLEAYGRATETTLFRCAVLAIAGEAPEGVDSAADHAGMATALARVLAGLPRSGGNPSFLPADVVAEQGLDPTIPLAGTNHAGLAPVIAALAAAGRRHAQVAEVAVATLPGPIRLAFLPLALTGPTFDRVTSAGYDPRAGRPLLSPLRRTWLLWRAARRAR